MTIPETPIKEWDELEPRYQELTSRPLSDQTAYQFLLDWSELVKGIEETSTFLNLRSDLNTGRFNYRTDRPQSGGAHCSIYATDRLDWVRNRAL
jgi:hypothetical protein